MRKNLLPSLVCALPTLCTLGDNLGHNPLCPLSFLGHVSCNPFCPFRTAFFRPQSTLFSGNSVLDVAVAKPFHPSASSFCTRSLQSLVSGSWFPWETRVQSLLGWFNGETWDFAKNRWKNCWLQNGNGEASPSQNNHSGTPDLANGLEFGGPYFRVKIYPQLEPQVNEKGITDKSWGNRQ